jgi:glucose-1-phosphate thymidylyltransferase
MEIAKALILTGPGSDDRPWATASGTPKHLFPVANRPILFHNLEALGATGVQEATILVDPGAHRAIRSAAGDGRAFGLSLRYDEWQPSVGVRGALAAGRAFLEDEPVLVQHGDALLRDRMIGHVSAFTRERLDALAFTLTSPCGSVDPGYLLSARAVSMLLDDPSASGHPIDGVLAGGGRVRVAPVDGLLPCHGDEAALLESNRAMLERLLPSPDHPGLDDCVVQGAVDIDPTARVSRSMLRGPIIIGPGARITDAYIGPSTAIGAGAVIEGTEIEYSIVLEEAVLRFVGTRIESSVIGRRARVARTFRLPGALRLSVGEGAEVQLA